jgi:two-component system chemotaxis response regulator CheY
MGNKILLVDDATFMRLLLKDILTSSGYNIVGEAQDGSDSIILYKRLRPDLVIMDITMHEMDGITAVKEILRFDPKAKIVMCSAMGQQNMVIQSIQSGALDFIVKPFQPERVVEAVRKSLMDLEDYADALAVAADAVVAEKG